MPGVPSTRTCSAPGHPRTRTTGLPRLYYGDKYTGGDSDRWLTSARYLNFQSFSVGYTLPQRVVARLGLNKLRIYATGENLYFWSARKGLDPRYAYDETEALTVYSPHAHHHGGHPTVVLTFKHVQSMKQIAKIFSITAAAAVLLSGCIKEIVPQGGQASFDQANEAEGSYDNFVAAITNSLAGSFAYRPAASGPSTTVIPPSSSRATSWGRTSPSKSRTGM